MNANNLTNFGYWETPGFKALGYSTSISTLAAIVINGAFSYPTYDVSSLESFYIFKVLSV